MTDPSPPLISLRGISKRFPGVVALDDVSFDVQRGELVAICGENGAGKSTLMKILSGVITEHEGEIHIGGKNVRFEGTTDAEHAGISIIHQELNLVEQLSAAANVFLGRELRGRFGLLDDRSMERASARILTELECGVSPTALVGSLRVGDQQLIEIAKAISLAAEILIMDEPTSALTNAEVERLYRVIERLRVRGVTILYISHKMEEVFRLSDRVVVLRDGRHVDTLVTRETTPKAVTSLMVGRDVVATQVDAPRVPGEVVLEVEGLSLPWPGHARGWRLKEINFALRKGEILGIAGLMGAGRTELLECLFGSSPLPFSGSLRLEGKPVRFEHPREACKAGIALVTEDRKRLGLFAQMNVGENISLCVLEEARRGKLVSRVRESALASSAVRDLQVKTASLEAAITSLSGGNQQKAILGRWLLTRPRVLLLDDPTRGVDVGAKAELYRLMDRLCREGLAILLTSSELPELLAVCDRILVLAEGRLTAELSRQEATEQKIMEAATLGAARE